MDTLRPCPAKVFNMKLDWAKTQPGFSCWRDHSTLEYRIDGRAYLRVVRRGNWADLYEVVRPVKPVPEGFTYK